MKKDKEGRSSLSELRARAEAVMKSRRDQDVTSTLPPQEIQKLLNELQTHQIELEMQNEELRRAHSELEQSRDRYSDLYDFAPVGYFTSNEKGLILEANLTLAEMLGTGRQQLINRSFSAFVPDRDQDAYYLVWRRLSERTERQRFESPLKTGGGTSFRALIDSVRISDPDDPAPRFQMAVSDITELKRAQQELSRLHLEYESLYEFAPCGYVTLNARGIITRVNLMGARLLGSSKQLLSHSGFSQYVTSGWEDFYLEAQRRASETGEKQSVELPLKTDTDSPLWVRAEIQALRAKPGAVDQWQVVLVDIAEQKRVEKEKKKLEKRLAQTQKMEAIGTLAGGIAHDFNNILAIVTGATELVLLDTPEPSKQRLRLQGVLLAAKRGKALTNQILTFSRHAEMERNPLDIRVTIEESVKLLRASLPATIEIRKRITDTPAMILGNSLQIHQVLMNLCTNAAHAMREEGGTLDISLEEQDVTPDTVSVYPDLCPGPYLNLTVRDTGHGMEEKVVQQIFDPFFTTKQQGQGTGMGLSVVHGIVKSLEGAIQVDSAPGKGTMFQIFFPRIDATPEAPPAVARMAVPRPGIRFLLVDDEEAIVEFHTQVLERLGCEVVPTTGSVEALRVFGSTPDAFDVVITDMTMPKMTGLDLSRELLRIRHDIPIIVCTGFNEDINPEIAEKAGIRKLLLKPVSILDLTTAIQSVLDQGIEERRTPNPSRTLIFDDDQ